MNEQIKNTLSLYKITCEIVNTIDSLLMTSYELKLAPGTRISKLKLVVNDVARDLGLLNKLKLSSRDNNLYFDIIKAERKTPCFNDMVKRANLSSYELLIGMNTTGHPVKHHLHTLPHLLLAGSTGSGKSVALHMLICSLIKHNKADSLQMVLIDPKRIELNIYNDLPHLLCPVVTDTSEIAEKLRQCVQEMEHRYKILEKHPHVNFSTIVIVIDELADLMLASDKDLQIETNLIRLAQKARACRMHIIAATQRPSRDVITGLINANFPSRLCFKTSSAIDSRIVIENNEAASLIGSGDGIFKSVTGKEIRVQTPFLSQACIKKIVDEATKSNQHFAHLHKNKDMHKQLNINEILWKIVYYGSILFFIKSIFL